MSNSDLQTSVPTTPRSVEELTAILNDTFTRNWLDSLSSGVNITSSLHVITKEFKIMDVDGSRFLTRSEFYSGIKNVFVDITQIELDNLFAYFDKTNSDQVSIPEMMLKFKLSGSTKRYETIRRVFDVINTDKSGHISLYEFTNFLLQLSPTISDNCFMVICDEAISSMEKKKNSVVKK